MDKIDVYFGTVGAVVSVVAGKPKARGSVAQRSLDGQWTVAPCYAVEATTSKTFMYITPVSRTRRIVEGTLLRQARRARHVLEWASCGSRLRLAGGGSWSRPLACPLDTDSSLLQLCYDVH